MCNLVDFFVPGVERRSFVQHRRGTVAGLSGQHGAGVLFGGQQQLLSSTPTLTRSVALSLGARDRQGCAATGARGLAETRSSGQDCRWLNRVDARYARQYRSLWQTEESTWCFEFSGRTHPGGVVF